MKQGSNSLEGKIGKLPGASLRRPPIYIPIFAGRG